MAKAKSKKITLEEALVPVEEQPYEVPENWCWTRIKYVSNIVTGSTPSKKNEKYYGGDFPFFKPADLDAEDNVIEASEYLSEEGRNVSRIIPELSTAVCCIGSIGKSGLLRVEGTTNQQINSMIPKINPLYLYYYSKTNDFVAELWNKSTATTISLVNKNNMETNTFPLAPLAEQKRIVEQIESIFAKLDEARGKAQDVLDGFEDRKSAILFRAYSGELTATWREQNSILNESWERVRIQDVCKVNPPKINVKEYDDNLEVSFFPMPALSEITGTITDPQTRKLSEVKKGFTNFMEGDVVFAKITPCMENGKSAIIPPLVNDIGYGTTEFYVMRCSDKLLNGYLYHLVRSKHFRDEAKAVMTGAVGQQRVPKSFIEDYKINLPLKEEQEEILKIVDEMVKKERVVADNCEKVIEQIELMKKSVLAKAFRGELGTNVSSEENSIELLKKMIGRDKIERKD